MNLHGLMHIWLVVAPNQVIPPFSKFQDGGELEYDPRSN